MEVAGKKPKADIESRVAEIICILPFHWLAAGICAAAVAVRNRRRLWLRKGRCLDAVVADHRPRLFHCERLRRC